MKMESVYLAGPDVFRADVDHHFEVLKNICENYKFKAFSPFDTKLDNIPIEHRHTVIGEENFDLINKADIVVANLRSFRGVNVDDGTAVEIGYAFALGKMVCGYTSDFRTLKDKVNAHPAFSGEERDVFPVVEDFDLTVNLMIVRAIKESGGIIAPTFEDAIKYLYWKRMLK